LITIQERHALLVVDVVQIFNELVAKGHPVRGVAGKISRKLGTVSERYVRTIIRNCHGGRSDVLSYSPPKFTRRANV
jgi:hypothetical protein